MTTQSAARRRGGAIIAVIAVALSLGLVGLPRPGQAADSAHTFIVNDLAPSTSDANLSDRACATSTGTCTLRAAVEQANWLAANDDSQPVVITTRLSGTIWLASNDSSAKMTTSSQDWSFGDSGAYYWITAPGLTIDLGGTVGIEPSSDTPQGTAFLVEAPDVTIENFVNIQSAETAIFVGAKGPRLTVRNGGFHSPWDGERALILLNGAKDVTLRDIHVGELYGPGAIVLSSNATVTNLTLERVKMDNGDLSKGVAHDGIVANGTATLVGLSITNSTFSNFKSGHYALNFYGIALSGTQVQNNQFVTNNSGGVGVIRFHQAPTGNPNVFRYNVFDNTATTTSSRAIYLDAAAPVGAISIADNYFVGFTNTQAIYMAGTTAVAVERNRFGNPSWGATDVNSETGDYTYVDNHDSGTNKKIRTWWPQTVTSVAGQCAIDILAAPPPAATYPTYPISIDVYYTATTVAEVYLGRIDNISGAAQTVRVPFTGAGGGIRLQTKDATGRTSQYSRLTTLTATDTCPPQVTVNQAASQADPTNRRDIHFTVQFSEPVPAPAASAFSLAGSSAPGARVTSVAKVDPVTYDVVVRVDGAGTAQLSLPAGAVKDAAGNASAPSQSSDNIVTFVSPLALTPVAGTLTTADCASYQIVEVSVGTDGYPSPAAPISIAATPTTDGLAQVSPNPAILATADQAVTVSVCAQAGAQVPDGTLPISHTVTSEDPAFDGLLLGQAAVPMQDLRPRWSLVLSAAPPSGQAVAEGGIVTYTALATHLGGQGTTLTLAADLSGVLDDASFQAGSVTIEVSGAAMSGTGSLGPSTSGIVAFPPITLAPSDTVTIRFAVSVDKVATSAGDGELIATIASSDAASQPTDCAAGSADSCRTTTNLIAALTIVKTGPATLGDGGVSDIGPAAPDGSPVAVERGRYTWVYTVTNIGTAPLRDLAVTDDQGVAVSCPETDLAPGAHMECLGTGDV